ncbi:MAG: toprim domain-containing protein, partial [Bacteroidaceae bacterium]|nr:toprim domain-containing protein [Bacteroidaceae bacterium]
CKDCKRDNSIICVVKDIQDVIAIENTHQYRGTYHVLGGILSPVEGVGPADLYIDSLVKRANSDIVKEIILALNSTTDGETTKFYISQQLSTCDIKLSAISSGIAVGEELEYADEITLGRSISDRKEFK